MCLDADFLLMKAAWKFDNIINNIIEVILYMCVCVCVCVCLCVCVCVYAYVYKPYIYGK